MTDIRIAVASFVFSARFEQEAAPLTCARFESILPSRQRIIHVRWSGEACWIPLGQLDFGIDHENATSYPAPGQVLLYPGGVSETEILIAYGAVRQQGGPAGGQPFSNDCRRRRAAPRPRRADPVARRAGYRVRPHLTRGMRSFSLRGCRKRRTLRATL